MNWVIIGRQYLINWVKILVKNKLGQYWFQEKMNWVIIGRQYMINWVTILVSGKMLMWMLVMELLTLEGRPCGTRSFSSSR
jgi:hypothetical protein